MVSGVEPVVKSMLSEVVKAVTEAVAAPCTRLWNSRSISSRLKELPDTVCSSRVKRQLTEETLSKIFQEVNAQREELNKLTRCSMRKIEGVLISITPKEQGGVFVMIPLSVKGSQWVPLVCTSRKVVQVGLKISRHRIDELKLYVAIDLLDKDMWDMEAGSLKAALGYKIAPPKTKFSRADDCRIMQEYYLSGDWYDALAKYDKDPSKRLEQVMPMAIAAAKSLASIHEVNCVHNDIKTENILFDRHGNAQVTDFGMLNGIQAPVTIWQRGTVGKRAPEIVRFAMMIEPFCYKKGEDPRAADIWGLGVAIAEAFVQERFLAVVFSSPALEDILLEGKLRSVRSDEKWHPMVVQALVGKAMPQNLAKLIAQMCSINITKRPTIAEVQLQLQQINSIKRP